MKDVNLLVWLTQLGLSVALPLALFLGVAVWLHNSRGWGSWIIWVGLLVGISSAVSGFRQSGGAAGDPGENPGRCQG